MAILQGVQVMFGSSTSTLTPLYASVSARSEGYKREADTQTIKNAAGEIVGKSYSGYNDTLSLELNVAKENGAVPATAVPGTKVTLAVLDGADGSLAGDWILDSAEVKAQNDGFAVTSLGLSRYPLISPA